MPFLTCTESQPALYEAHLEFISALEQIYENGCELLLTTCTSVNMYDEAEILALKKITFGALGATAELILATINAEAGYKHPRVVAPPVSRYNLRKRTPPKRDPDFVYEFEDDDAETGVDAGSIVSRADPEWNWGGDFEPDGEWVTRFEHIRSIEQ